MIDESLLSRLQRSKFFFIAYLSIPFIIFAVTQNKQSFYMYFIMSLLLCFLACILRIVREEDKKDYDLGILTAVKIINIATILYTPKYVWIINGIIINTLLINFIRRHSKVGFSEIWNNRVFFALYTTLYLVIFYKSVPTEPLLASYGILLSGLFVYSLYCAKKTNMFYRGLLYGAVSIVMVILIGRYSVEKLSMFYLYVEAVFVGLAYVCYLNWYNYFVYLHYLPFVKKKKAHLFFNTDTLLNIIGIVGLFVVTMNYPLTKATVINSCIVAIAIWILYSTAMGLLNLGETAQDIAEHDEDKEVTAYFKSLPETIRRKIQKEVEVISDRKERCKRCKAIYEKINSLPDFMKNLGE